MAKARSLPTLFRTLVMRFPLQLAVLVFDVSGWVSLS